MTFVLRDYQESVVDKVALYLAQNPQGSPLAAVPGGGGKSAISGRLIQRMLIAGKTGLYLTMTEELVVQTFEHVMKIDANAAARCSIACAGLGKPQLHGAFILGTAQTVVNYIDQLGGIDYVIVDEAHTIPRDPKSMYGRIFKALGVPIIHLSGTPWRMDSGMLHMGDGATADKLVAQIFTTFLQKEGWLIRNRYRQPVIQIDASKVKVSRGEFSQREMEEIAMDMALSEAVAKDVKQRFEQEKRSRGLLFCVSIDHAEMMADCLRRIGMRAAAASSRDKGERRDVIKSYRRGELDILCHVNIVSTGFDDPWTDFIAWARPTLSPGLFTQGTWRGARVVWPKGFNQHEATAEERLAAIDESPKRDCYVVDYAGNLERHGVIEDIEKLGAKKIKGKFLRSRQCPNITCEAIVSRSADSCPECGEQIVSHARALQQSAAQTAAASFDVGVWLDVHDYRTGIQSRPGRRDSFRLTFFTADRRSYALFVDFDGHDRGKQERRWAACGGQSPFPSSAASAHNRAQREIRMPLSVKVQRRPGSTYIGVADVDMGRKRQESA